MAIFEKNAMIFEHLTWMSASRAASPLFFPQKLPRYPPTYLYTFLPDIPPCRDDRSKPETFQSPENEDSTSLHKRSLPDKKYESCVLRLRPQSRMLKLSPELVVPGTDYESTNMQKISII